MFLNLYKKQLIYSFSKKTFVFLHVDLCQYFNKVLKHSYYSMRKRRTVFLASIGTGALRTQSRNIIFYMFANSKFSSSVADPISTDRICGSFRYYMSWCIVEMTKFAKSFREVLFAQLVFAGTTEQKTFLQTWIAAGLVENSHHNCSC